MASEIFPNETTPIEQRDIAKAKYPDNHWWNSADARARAYFQFHEPVQIIPFHEYVYDMGELLGRLVWMFELLDIGCRHEVAEEVERAWAGNPFSYWERIAAQYRALGCTPDHLPGYQVYKMIRALEEQERGETEAGPH